MNTNTPPIYQYPIVKNQYNGCFLDVTYIALVLFSITLLVMYVGEWLSGNTPSWLYIVGIILGLLPMYFGRKYVTHYVIVPLNFLQISDSHIIIKQRKACLEVPLENTVDLHVYYNGLSRKNSPTRIEWKYNQQFYSYMIPIESENDENMLYNTLKSWYAQGIAISEFKNGEQSHLFEVVA